MRALNAARKVTENAAGNPKKLERAIAAENDAANIKRNAHNTYVLELASANAERKKLFSEDLPELLERMEEAQVRAIRETAKAIENASRLTNVTLQKICQKHEGVFSAAAMVDGKEDVAAWVKKLDCQPAPPPVDLTFVALPNVSRRNRPGRLPRRFRLPNSRPRNATPHLSSFPVERPCG